MSNIKQALINQNPSSLPQQFEESENKVQNLSRKIDYLQRSVDDDDPVIQKELKHQDGQIQQLLKELKNDFIQLEKNSKGTANINKLKRIRDEYQKQSERYNSISRSFMNKSGKIQSPQMRNSLKSSSGSEKFQVQYQRNNLLQSTITNNADMDNLILKQNQDDIDYIENKSNALQNCINELAIGVDGQGQQLDIINFDQQKTKDNMTAAQYQLNQANQSSSSSRKWYCIILLIALVLAIVLLLIIFRDKINQ